MNSAHRFGLAVSAVLLLVFSLQPVLATAAQPEFPAPKVPNPVSNAEVMRVLSLPPATAAFHDIKSTGNSQAGPLPAIPIPSAAAQIATPGQVIGLPALAAPIPIWPVQVTAPFSAPPSTMAPEVLASQTSANWQAFAAVSPSGSTGPAFRGATVATINWIRHQVLIPATVQAGDLLLLFGTFNLVSVSVSGPPASSGWIELDRVKSGSMQAGAWLKIADASDAGQAVTLSSSGVTKSSLSLLAYSGVDTFAPFQGYAVATASGFSTSHTTPMVESCVGGSIIVSYWSDKSSLQSGWLPPQGQAVRAVSLMTGGGRIASVAVDSETTVPSGVYGGLTATSAGVNKVAMWTMALNPRIDIGPTTGTTTASGTTTTTGAATTTTGAATTTTGAATTTTGAATTTTAASATTTVPAITTTTVPAPTTTMGSTTTTPPATTTTAAGTTTTAVVTTTTAATTTTTVPATTTTTLPATTTTTAAPNPSGYAGHPPAGKVAWGAAIGGNADPVLHEQPTGQTLALRRTFFQWNHRVGYMIDTARGDLARGRLPWVSIKTPSWAAMGAGQHDAEIDQMLRALDGLGGPVWLTLHHEPEGGGGVNAPDDPAGPSGHVTMNRRVRERISALGVDNVALAPILMSWTWDQRSGRDPNQWWAPGIYDFLGVDHYTEREVSLVDPVWLGIRAWADNRGVEIAVGEWGMRGTDAAAGNRVREWYDHAASSQADGLGARVVGLAAFDSPLNSPSGSWELRGEQLNAFRALMGDSRTWP